MQMPLGIVSAVWRLPFILPKHNWPMITAGRTVNGEAGHINPFPFQNEYKYNKKGKMK
jgi:hypothetical protein